MSQVTTWNIPGTPPLTPVEHTTLLNAKLNALASMSSGSSEPTGTVAFQPWYDSTTTILKIRNAANSGWTALASFAGGSWKAYYGTDVLDLKIAFEEITGLTELTSAALDDNIGINDTSSSDPKRRKITVSNVLKAVNLMSAVATPALTSKLLAHDAAAVGSMTPQVMFNLYNALTAIDSVVAADVLSLYDASASSTKKVTVENLFNNALGVFTEETTPADADLILLRKAAGGIRRVQKSNLVGSAYSSHVSGSEQSVSSGSWNHGLGGLPKIYGVDLICKTTDGGFAVGDHIHGSISGDGNNFGVQAIKTTTAIAWRVGTGGVRGLNSSNLDFALTLGSWRIIPWAAR